MRKKGLNSVVKVSVCVLIAMGLLFATSCRQSEEEATPEAPEEKTGPNVPVVSVEPVNEDANAPKGVPIDIKLPKPMFVGTLRSFSARHHYRPRGGV